MNAIAARPPWARTHDRNGRNGEATLLRYRGAGVLMCHSEACRAKNKLRQQQRYWARALQAYWLEVSVYRLQKQRTHWRKVLGLKRYQKAA